MKNISTVLIEHGKIKFYSKYSIIIIVLILLFIFGFKFLYVKSIKASVIDKDISNNTISVQYDISNNKMINVINNDDNYNINDIIYIKFDKNNNIKIINKTTKNLTHILMGCGIIITFYLIFKIYLIEKYREEAINIALESDEWNFKIINDNNIY
jgi:energy-coupling factor transporter transmembrane protein EcfT